MSLLALVAYTIILEALAVAWTIAISNRRIWLSALIGAFFEPIKIVSLLLVVESQNKIVSVVAIAITCAVTNVMMILLFNKADAAVNKEKESEKENV
jgi:hypothetical protein